MRGAGGVDQRFRRDAADIEARSAEPVPFDEDRGDIAARTAADDENLAAKLVHFVSAALRFCVLSPPRMRGSRRLLQTERRTWRRRCWIPAFAGMTPSTLHSSMNSVAGASIRARRRWMKVAAS